MNVMRTCPVWYHHGGQATGASGRAVPAGFPVEALEPIPGTPSEPVGVFHTSPIECGGVDGEEHEGVLVCGVCVSRCAVLPPAGVGTGGISPAQAKAAKYGNICTTSRHRCMYIHTERWSFHTQMYMQLHTYTAYRCIRVCLYTQTHMQYT